MNKKILPKACEPLLPRSASHSFRQYYINLVILKIVSGASRGNSVQVQVLLSAPDTIKPCFERNFIARLFVF